MDTLKYGHIAGGMRGFVYGMSGSLRLYDLSGHFIYNDENYGSLLDDGGSGIIGWAVSQEQTCSTSDGGTSLWVICDLTAVFRLPVIYESATTTTNYAATMIGKTCDLILHATYYQFANVTTSTDDEIIIVGGSAATAVAVDDGWVEAMINPNKVASAGV